MTWSNCTEATEFIFSGFTDRPELQIALFVLFLVVYAVTLLGNLGMILLIRLAAQLQTPMYFFLSTLAFVDFWYSTFITPKFLADLLAERKVISYAACVCQYCFVSFFGVTESFLLTVMAYDRYVAICNPLLYTAVMSPRFCVQLVAGSFLAGFINGMIQTITTLKLSFCGPNVIDLFFCDISPLLSLSCSNTSVYHVILLAVACVAGIFTSLTILISYVLIFSNILKIRSAEGKRKGFNTCTSHVTVVTIFYGPALFIYMQPSTQHSRDQDKVVSVFYTMVTPMLNPLIYSLRNKEVKNAVKRVIEMNLVP
ncbi:olfactory receptor 5J3-like [Pelodiscus sinensis]|uniref:olfactory receptor 5J3-like n=1 Tax=Pelodiscus sinensis TaxID=13735 RepID=UPI0003C4CB21|nr:olfactory receptor 1052-like [Pelodiscus sinensis]|eukprot:XP_006117014.1 olfactory receptor 1052-like [Pelodiscus sinensis]